jgi:hypothetical protein
MIVEYSQPDGSTQFFGYMMSDGPLTKATGRILRARHHKCYHIARKREARGNAVTGRVVAGTPTAYQIEDSMLSDAERDALGIDHTDEAFLSPEQLRDRLAVLHEIAHNLGKAVGDPWVLEAFWAHENHGPYEHGHSFRLEPYQLMGHLHFAHGVGTEGHYNWAKKHEELHAQAHARVIERIRGAEKENRRAPRDWREQFTAELTHEEPHA